MNFVKTTILEAHGHDLIPDGYLIEWVGVKYPDHFRVWSYEESGESK